MGAWVCLATEPELDGFGAGEGLVAFGAAATAGPVMPPGQQQQECVSADGVKRTKVRKGG